MGLPNYPWCDACRLRETSRNSICHLNAGSFRFAPGGDEDKEDHSDKNAKDPPTSSSLLEHSSLYQCDLIGTTDPTTGGSVATDVGELMGMLVLEARGILGGFLGSTGLEATTAANDISSCSFLDLSAARILSIILSFVGSGGRLRAGIFLMPDGL